MSRASGTNWLRSALVLGAIATAGVQVWHAADTLAPKLAELPERMELFRDTEPRETNSDWIQAYRTLPRIAGRMPRDARILLLSSLMTPVQFEFYFMPRQFRKLLVFPPHLVEIVREHQPDLLEVVERRYRNLKERNLLFSRERLAEEIQRAQFLVVFDVQDQDYDLTDLPRRTELVFQHENASLYRILPLR